MNKLKKTLLPLLCMMMGMVMLSACEDDTKPQQPIKIELGETSKTLKVGETFTLTTTLTPKSDDAKITWSSSDEKIATVKGGEVTAVAEGSATITAKVENGGEATCKVTVMKKEDNEEPTPGALKFNKDEYSVQVGSELDMSEEISNFSDDIKWSTSDEKIATIDDEYGYYVTGVAEGTVTITAQLGDSKATCKVTVVKKEDNEEPTPGTLKFNKDEYSVQVGSELDLSEEISNFSYDIKWSTSDEKIATVDDEYGYYVTGVAEGTVTITAQLGDSKATCKVTVMKKEGDNEDPAPGALKFKQKTYKIDVDGTLDLAKELTGAKGELLWTSYDEEIATIDNKGVVTGVADGTVTISVDTNDDSVECTVVVGSGVSDGDDDDDDDEVNNGTTISLGVPDMDLTVGVSHKLKVIFLPIGSDMPITWSSSNDKVVSVKDGVVTALKEGHATITARLSNGAEAKIKITVKKKKEETTNPLKFKQKKYTIKVGETLNLKQELQGNKHKLLWLSYNEDVASVSDKGIVTAKEVGEAEISVDDDPWSTSCIVEVIAADE